MLSLEEYSKIQLEWDINEDHRSLIGLENRIIDLVGKIQEDNLSKKELEKAEVFTDCVYNTVINLLEHLEKCSKDIKMKLE